MNFEKRLITTFRTFVEKVFLPQCSKNESIMADWTKYMGMLSTENPNINEIQFYVDSIGTGGSQINPMLMQSQQSVPAMGKKEEFYNHSSVYNRKKQENMGFDNNNQDIGFNPNKTFGGQKAKLNPYNSTSQQFDVLGRKQFTNPQSVTNNQTKEQPNKFRSTMSNMGNAYKQGNIDNAPVMLASLEKLYKSLVENQQKIEALTQVGTQGQGQLGNQPYY